MIHPPWSAVKSFSGAQLDARYMMSGALGTPFRANVRASIPSISFF
jgi:hypothetical protein